VASTAAIAEGLKAASREMSQRRVRELLGELVSAGRVRRVGAKGGWVEKGMRNPAV
jgi:hypothetical protein